MHILKIQSYQSTNGLDSNIFETCIYQFGFIQILSLTLQEMILSIRNWIWKFDCMSTNFLLRTYKEYGMLLWLIFIVVLYPFLSQDNISGAIRTTKKTL